MMLNTKLYNIQEKKCTSDGRGKRNEDRAAKWNWGWGGARVGLSLLYGEVSEKTFEKR